MPKSEKYIFRKVDNIGAAAAEDDIAFLESCFVDTGELQSLLDCSNPQRIVVGRTGAGKTALLENITYKEERVIRLEPESLSLSYITNSTILTFLSRLGVDLDIFFKFLWRHVFTIEIIKRHFKINNDEDKQTFFNKIWGMFQDDKHKNALAYLNKWGETFWEETEYRVKEVTTKLENGIQGEIGAKAFKSVVKAGGGMSLSEEEKKKIVSRAQTVVNKVQIRQLSDILKLVDDILSDPQKRYYILIDRLDEKWIDDAFRYRLIRALIETIRDFRKVRHAKIIVAIRFDLLDRVFNLTRNAGFQKEKYESLYRSVSWNKSQLMNVLDERINHLIRPRYTKQKVTHVDILPKKIIKKDTIDYILERTMMRPRDVIMFFNFCIKEAVDHPRITSEMVRKAEGEYSRGRLDSVIDEWFVDYPNLRSFLSILKGRHKTFGFSDIGKNEFIDFCIDVVDKGPRDDSYNSILWKEVLEVVDNRYDLQDFKRRLFSIFYHIGLVGLKLESYEKVVWAISGRRNISSAEINDNTKIVIHHMFWRVLGVKKRRAYITKKKKKK